MTSKNTLVIGASVNPARYSHMAVKKLRLYGHPVWAIGLRPGIIDGVVIQTGFPALRQIDTVTLYINPTHQIDYYDYIINLKPRRIIFNPGTENPTLEQLALNQGIECLRACTLVLLSIGQF